MRFPRLTAVLLCAMAASTGIAQDQSRGAALKIPVWVESEGGFWNDAKAADFSVDLNGERAEVTKVLGPADPSIILVVFDTVADLSRWAEARRTLKTLFAGLDGHHWIGLLNSQDGLSVIQEPTSDRELLYQKLESVQVGGSAGLLDTLRPVLKLASAMARKADVRISVLYITDSAIGNYRGNYINPTINSSDYGDLSRRFSDRAVRERVSQLADSLSEFTIPLFIFHLVHRDDSINLAYQNGIERISGDSGAVAVFCRTVDEIGSSLQGLFRRISSEYVLIVDSPSNAGASMRLRVGVSGAFRTVHPGRVGGPR